jgi:hypothetical protein
MAEPEKGKTLWEMFTERLKGGGDGEGIAFLNPLDLRVDSAVAVSFANGAELADRDFAVREIREYTRRIGSQDFRFTDYVLNGINKKSPDADAVLVARLRGVPNQAGSHDQLLLRLYDEFAFSEDFLAVLKDDAGIFEVTDEKGIQATFSRINDLGESYETAVLVIAATNPNGKAATGKTTTAKLEYWDYWRDAELGTDAKAKEFIFVEMNSDTGWIQIWRGSEFFA